MDELNFSAPVQRVQLFAAAIDELQREYQSRLQHLQTREHDIGHLQELAEHLTARGWKVRADARAMPYTLTVVLRLFVTLDHGGQRGELMEHLLKECIAVVRNESADCGTDAAYDITLLDRVRVLMRVLVTDSRAAKAPA